MDEQEEVPEATLMTTDGRYTVWTRHKVAVLNWYGYIVIRKWDKNDVYKIGHIGQKKKKEGI